MCSTVAALSVDYFATTTDFFFLLSPFQFEASSSNIAFVTMHWLAVRKCDFRGAVGGFRVVARRLGCEPWAIRGWLFL